MIETAMRDYYDNDLDTMVEAIKLNITVSLIYFSEMNFRKPSMCLRSIK